MMVEGCIDVRRKVGASQGAMRRMSLGIVPATLGVALMAACARDSGIEFRNGHWYTGSGFESRSYYAIDGRLSSRRPDSVTRVVDLAGGYAIPPFGEAHNHRPDGWPGTERHVAQFIEHGIFYVMNPNSFVSMTAEIEGELNRPESIDVLFSNAGLTAPLSHVTELYERNLRLGIMPEGWTSERLDGEAFVIVGDIGDLDAKWPALLESGPDFIKVFMGFSEDHEARAADTTFRGKRGIDPALVPRVVERAHAAGLRVAAHIETAEDFRRAVAAGVDIIAHMPASWRVGEGAGYADTTTDRWMLADADAAEAARRDVVVVAHVWNGRFSPVIARIHRHNLELLDRHGVRLAIGSDNYRQTALREAIYLQSTGLFAPDDVLRIASELTPRAIFPDRRIGRLRDGYEASFLVIEGDPIAEPLFDVTGEDLGTMVEQVVSRIRLRVKQGYIFEADSTEG